MSDLPRPQLGELFSQWAWQPVAIVLTVALGAWYLTALRRLSGERWRARRTAMFMLGLAALLWTSCGFLQAYQRSVFWVWTTQTLALFLVVPMLLLAGQPLHLARATSSRAPGSTKIDRFLTSGIGRTLGNPLVGPALVPLVSAGLFFGPLAGWAISSEPAGWVLQLVLLVLGALIALPLVDTDLDPSSLAVGLTLAIGSFELVLDAVPGIALRLHTTLATGYFDHRIAHSWTPSALHDQQLAGSILWVIAELIDLPFLLIVYRRWLRADARDAAAADAILDAERAARGALPGNEAQPPDTDVPWWVSDPAMQARLRRNQD